MEGFLHRKGVLIYISNLSEEKSSNFVNRDKIPTVALDKTV